jgi:hypothetical protein
MSESEYSEVSGILRLSAASLEGEPYCDRGGPCRDWEYKPAS